MPKVRVDINQTNGRVDRTLPSLLQGQVTQREWREFAAKIEQATLPALRIGWMFALVPLVLFLVTVIIMASTFANEANNTDPNSNSGPPMAIFVLVPILWVVTIGGLFACVYWIRTSTTEKLQSICEQASRAHAGLSFHLKEDQYYVPDYGHNSGGHSYRTKYYIEIQIRDSPRIVNPPPPSSYSHDPAVSPTYTPDVEAPIPMVIAEPETTVESRLEQLERIRSHLTAKEYAQKRQDILNSL